MTITIRLAALLALAATATTCNCGTPLPQDPFDPLGPWHQRHADCGIPPFAYRLPADTQSQLLAVWRAYAPGDDCEAEQRATEAILARVDESARRQALRGMCGPGFLANATAPARDAFHAIWFDDALDLDAKQAAFSRLAAEHLRGAQAEKFAKFQAALSAARKEREEMIAGFSPAARDAYQKWNVMRKAERTFLTGLPLDVRVELGLVCRCCNGCTAPAAGSGDRPVGPATKSGSHRARRHASVHSLSGALRRADRQLLGAIADVECVY